jgi:hypothetical protein
MEPLSGDVLIVNKLEMYCIGIVLICKENVKNKKKLFAITFFGIRHRHIVMYSILFGLKFNFLSTKDARNTSLILKY